MLRTRRKPPAEPWTEGPGEEDGGTAAAAPASTDTVPLVSVDTVPVTSTDAGPQVSTATDAGPQVSTATDAGPPVSTATDAAPPVSTDTAPPVSAEPGKETPVSPVSPDATPSASRAEEPPVSTDTVPLVGTQTSHDIPAAGAQVAGPVFLDASGRRNRRFRVVAHLVIGLCVAYAVVLALSLLGAAPVAPSSVLPLPGVPGKRHGGEHVKPRDDRPTDSPVPSGGTASAPPPYLPASPTSSAAESPSGGAPTPTTSPGPSSSGGPGPTDSATSSPSPSRTEPGDGTSLPSMPTESGGTSSTQPGFPGLSLFPTPGQG
jgi:hypothetical protein